MANCRWFAVIFFMVATLPAVAGTTLRVEGDAGALRAALAKASADPDVTEIILADGVYEGSFQLLVPKDHEGDVPRLTLRAADGAKPLLRGSVRIREAEAVDAGIGLYRVKQLPPGDAQMWERNNRIRYTTLASVGSVGAYPASCFADHHEGYLYFRTSDGKPPASHDLWLSRCARNSRGLFLRRPNVTIEGLHFADYVADNACAIQSFGANVIVRNCRFDNCETGWGLAPGSDDGLIEQCVGVDVARGVYSNANNITIRNNRFEKRRDQFLYQVYPQDDSAYQVYHPGRGGVIEGNLAKGYLQAIFIKAPSAPYIIRHNTVIDSHMAIGFSSGMKPGNVVSHNIVVDARSLLAINHFQPDSVLDYNVLWQPREIGEFEHSTAVIRGANLGKHHVLADPLFVDATNGDYRVLPGSPAVALADGDGRPAGAFGVAELTEAKDTQPTLSLAFEADSKPFGPTGDYTFTRDPWIGGGTTHIRELHGDGMIRRLTGNTTIVVRPRAFDAAGNITKLRMTVDDAEPVVVDFSHRVSVTLPDVEGDHRLVMAAVNDRGVWSEPAEVVVRVDRTAPQLAAAPQVTANAHGFVMHAMTDEPCLAELHYGAASEALNQVVKAAPRRVRTWDANDGGEWIETWQIPKRDHIIGVLQPDSGDGSTLYAKLVFVDQAGLSSETDVVAVQLTGPAQTFEVSHEGLDLQTAVDLALPGDRILIAPGVYTDSVYITRGGVEGAPITIEAEPDIVTLDGAKRVNALINLDGAPHVTLRGLRILYYKKAGIYAHASPNTTIDRCVFYNGPGWATGYHVFAFYCPQTTITRSLAVGAEIGFYLLKSPYATLLHNTASQSMYAAALYPYSLEGTTQMYNSFAYAGNDSFSGEIGHPDELKTFRSDYNNLGSSILAFHRDLERTDPGLYETVKAEAFEPKKYDEYIRTASKAVVGVGGRYLTLKAWREASGQDMHSIFADPAYIRPYAPIDRWDWRVVPDSANLTVRDEQGMPIGAFGPME